MFESVKDTFSGAFPSVQVVHVYGDNSVSLTFAAYVSDIPEDMERKASR